MSGALALRDDQQDWTEPQKAALAQLGVGEAPRGDQLVFLHVAQRMRLDPFNKEIYMIGRWDPEAGKKKWAIQVAIDGFRSRSEEHPQFGGCDSHEWCGSDGQWTDVWLSDEPPKAARFTVHRKDQDKPIQCIAIYKEYVQTKKDGSPTQRWRTAPAAQLAKCAEALTRRTAFPRQLGGVYAQEELDHLSNPGPQTVVIESERVDEPAEPDWDALITEHEAAGDLVKLGEVWKLARGLRPNDGA
ncbi:MAG: phage recombination protein Bet, partial [Candidatus Limnocylindria bacterium]